MELRDKTILILGGSGLVGEAVARKLLPLAPSRIVLVALAEAELQGAAEALRGDSCSTEIVCEWGNIFLPADVARRSRAEVLDDGALRSQVIHNLLDGLSAEIVERSYLFQLLDRYRPEAVVDCINTATAFAYQDVFQSARDLLNASRTRGITQEEVERHVLTLTMPPLIRHIQIAVEAMRRCQTRSYVKIGTSGTGGMGLNIPYTHSEERPSATLLTKSAVAGAHSLLLFLMARTPDAPVAHEIKPTAAIAWRKIAHGPVTRWGAPIPRFDCPTPLALEHAFQEGASGWTNEHRALESVYIDVGENGVFASEEFETVTAIGQMEFITPEEVAEYVVMELQGHTTGKDIVAALDSATAGPTYNAGVLRAAALERLAAFKTRHASPSVAFEMLGPPRLSKMLYEAYVWSQLRSNVRALAESDARDLSAEAAVLLSEHADLRSTIVSIGLPILVSDHEVYRGHFLLLPPDGSPLERLVARGWVDLRPCSADTWISRARRVVEQARRRGAKEHQSGSGVDWNALAPDDPISPARFATWVFRHEDDGERIKR